MFDFGPFGWTQLLTIIGFGITGVIAWGGFRSFDRWRREVIEGKKIDVAIEALTLAYKSKDVFARIRSHWSDSYDWKDMPEEPGDTHAKRSSRGAYYAVFTRMKNDKDFFEDVWRLQPKFMAFFGPEKEETFRKLHQARRNIEVAAQMLYEGKLEDDGPVDEETRKLYKRLRGDIWPGRGKADGAKDEVEELRNGFKTEIEAICLPLLKGFRAR